LKAVLSSVLEPSIDQDRSNIAHLENFSEDDGLTKKMHTEQGFFNVDLKILQYRISICVSHGLDSNIQAGLARANGLLNNPFGDGNPRRNSNFTWKCSTLATSNPTPRRIFAKGHSQSGTEDGTELQHQLRPGEMETRQSVPEPKRTHTSLQPP